MCGIAGIVKRNIIRDKNIIANMVESIKHRGPDGMGVYLFNNCALGHSRLSIVDLIGGKQPMLTPEGKIGITFNGEIYGYKNIKQNLNYPFQSNSDTEVILSLYAKYGSGLLEHLPGMFSFALWDEGKQLLFCARDRFGEKPFYYAVGDNGEFIFASEIKAVLESKLFTPEIDTKSLAHYLQKLYVHPMKTIYKNIHTLPPAHYLTYTKDIINVERYWNYPSINNSISLEEAIDEFQSLLQKSVSKQLVADVPVGAFLSGGLDSSTIVALSNEYTDNLRTFSFNFEGDLSEKAYAVSVAEQYGTDHTELEEKDIRIDELLIQMQKVYDEPFADSSNIPTYLISKLASEHMKVILTGDGGDEMLAGYSYWYNDLLYMQKQINRKHYQRGLIYTLLALISRYRLPMPELWEKHLQGIKRYKKYGSLGMYHRIHKQYYHSDELIRLGLVPCNDNIPNNNTSDTLDDILKNDISDYLPGDILVKTDRASMANSLELRAPFLDVDFASFCISLPYNLKVNTKKDKLILRDAFEDLWPVKVRSRSKMGFGAPVNIWLKRPEILKMKEDYLMNKNNKIYAYLDYQNTKKYFDNDNYKTWILLVLSIWFENHINI